MQDFLHVFAELQHLLKKAEVLRKETEAYAFVNSAGHTEVLLQWCIGVRDDVHRRPSKVSFDEAELEFRMEISPEGKMANVLSCSAQVVVDGMNEQGEVLRFALHFDKHDPSQSSNELHAEYHWQVGGNKLDDFPIAGTLVLEGPRFPSHPLDPILLIDFILSHFNGIKRQLLMTHPDYVRYPRLLYESQSIYVAPFFRELNRILAESPFEQTSLWPALCGE